MEVIRPTGLAEDVEQKPSIQYILDKYKGSALIGIEYVVEIRESNGRNARYCCILCDKFVPNAMIHWTSYHHRLKYLEKHYPSVVRKYRPEQFTSKANKQSKVVQIMAEAIENSHGRLPVKSMTEFEFNRESKRHAEDILKGFHYDEKFGPNFLDVVEETLQKLKIAHNKSGDNRAEANEQSILNHRLVVNSSDNGNTSLQILQLTQERNKWARYRYMLEKRLTEIEALQRGYDKSPESHPLYSEEWDMFWVRRFKQLKADNTADPKTYDYKPEWVIYWTKRMKELVQVEVEKVKKELKLNLGLPEDIDECDEQRYQLKTTTFRPVDGRGTVDPRLSRTPLRSRSPHGRDRHLRSRTRSRSPSLREYELSKKKNYQEQNSHFHSLAPDEDYNFIDNGREDYYKSLSSRRYCDSADAQPVASTSKFIPSLGGRNPLETYTLSGRIGQVPEQRFVDSCPESMATAPSDRLEQTDARPLYQRREYTERRTAYNIGDKPTEEPTMMEKSVDAIVANDRQIFTLAVIDRSVDDGAITQINWKRLQKPLTRALIDVLRRNHGPEAQYRDAGWYQGRIKLIAFKDKRSPDLYIQAIESIGEVWRGAKLDLVPLSEAPSRPRTYAEVPAEPSRPRDILELIQNSNPRLPTHNWKVIKVSFEKFGIRQATITINGRSIAPLEETDGHIRYGSQTIRLRIYHEDKLTNKGSLAK